MKLAPGSLGVQMGRGGGRWQGTALSMAMCVALSWGGVATDARAQAAVPALLNPAQTTQVVDARDALRRGQAARLAALKSDAVRSGHPLAIWFDYWELNNRLRDATQGDLDAFYARWPGSYHEDRLRNDWLLELGRREDWRNFAVEYPKFVLKDDREAACYAVLVDHFAGRDVADAAREAWAAQTSSDQGCKLLADTLLKAGVLQAEDIWRKARATVDLARPAVAAAAVSLIDAGAAQRVAALYRDPAAFLAREAKTDTPLAREMTVLALQRQAMNDHDAAWAQLERRERALGPERASWVWAAIGKWMGIRLSERAPEAFQRAARGAREDQWLNNTLEWKVRAALRAGRWQQAMQGINAMPQSQQAEPVWVYWKAHALRVLSETSQDGEVLARSSKDLLASIASPFDYYGKLAAEDLGWTLRLPAAPPPLSAQERERARSHAGLHRALMSLEAGLRSEGVREWNYSIRGMSDRDLLAAAAWACERAVWDRCIHTSERTSAEIDLAQRFPMPFRSDVVRHARGIDLDPAYVYGLIRQESRFVMDIRSGAGAAGLMQLMPATARWTARRMGVPYTPAQITDKETNLTLGTGYLKLVLDDMGGSQALAAAAYNAGPNRPRRWREGPELDAAIWTENIPFNETRNYVQKVLSNASVYAAVLNGDPPRLRERLGAMIGPRPQTLVAEDRELP